MSAKTTKTVTDSEEINEENLIIKAAAAAAALRNRRFSGLWGLMMLIRHSKAVSSGSPIQLS